MSLTNQSLETEKKNLNYKEIELNDLSEMVALYVETFNAAPWND